MAKETKLYEIEKPARGLYLLPLMKTAEQTTIYLTNLKNFPQPQGL